MSITGSKSYNTNNITGSNITSTDLATNTTNITTLQQITTGQTYTFGTDTTTFDNNVSINNNLLVGGVNISSAVAQVPINTSNITALQQITTGQTYTSGTDTTTLDNNVIISGTLSITGNILEPTITANTLIISPAELSCLESIGSNIQTQLNNKVGLTGTETINGVKTFGSVPLCATNATTSSQLTNKAYVDTAISSISGSVLTTNTVQNITANKTFYGASLLIDDGSGDNTTISQLNQITNFKNNNLVNTTITTVGLIPAGGLNKIALTDGSNPTSAQILNSTITGTNIPNQLDTYYVSAHTYNASIEITTQGVPVGQIRSINIGVPIGTFITSNIGTNFTAGTYITGVAPGIDLYYISQNALNTTLFKVNHTRSLITTNLTLSASTASAVIQFKNDGAFQFLTNNASGNQIMPLSINSTAIAINTATTINATTTINGAATFNDNNITIGSGSCNVGTGSLLTNNVIIGTLTPNTVAVIAGANVMVGSSAGRNITTAARSNTFVGCNAGVGNTQAFEGTFIGVNAGFQQSGVNGGIGVYNTCVGTCAGQAIITTAAQNTLIGGYSGTAITTGQSNTISGYGAAGSLLTGNNNTIIGVNSGDLITGSSNICIGTGAAVPVAAGNNQIAIGSIYETMFIQGQLNFRMGNAIGAATTLPTINTTLAQLYLFSATTAYTITLPVPTLAAYNGAFLTFKRRTNNTNIITFAAGAGSPFLGIATITTSATIAVATSVFQITFLCDGVVWNVINQA